MRGEPAWLEVDSLLAEWEPQHLVVGLPYTTDGGESDVTARARQFAAQLAARYSLPIAYVDERLTSAEAESLLREQRERGTRRRRVRREDIDSQAARLIAETWLSE